MIRTFNGNNATLLIYIKKKRGWSALFLFLVNWSKLAGA